MADAPDQPTVMSSSPCCFIGAERSALTKDWNMLGDIDALVDVGAGGFSVAPDVRSCLADSDALIVAWDTARAPRFTYLCYALRSVDRPLLALTNGTAVEHALALVSGADAVLPVGVQDPEVLNLIVAAEVIAHRRHGKGILANDGPMDGDDLHWGPLTVDARAYQVTVSGTPIALPPRHVRLLAVLLSSPGTTFTRDRLLDDVWGLCFDPETNVVDVTIHRVRAVLRAAGVDDVIETVRGIGYRLAPPA